MFWKKLQYWSGVASLMILMMFVVMIGWNLKNIFFCACNAYYGLLHLKIQIEPIFPQLVCERPKVEVHINSFVWAFIVSAEAHKSGWPEALGFLIVSFFSKYNFLELGNIKILYTNKAQKRNTFTKAQLVQGVWRFTKSTSSLNSSTWK